MHKEKQKPSIECLCVFLPINVVIYVFVSVHVRQEGQNIVPEQDISVWQRRRSEGGPLEGLMGGVLNP